MSISLSPSLVRLYEESAEELGRLDALASVAPSAVSVLLQTQAIARLASPQATRAACASLVAARVDSLHAEALAPELADWRARVEDGERRARSGAALVIPAESSANAMRAGDAAGERVTDVRVADARVADARVADTRVADARVADALRPGAEPRPVLLRAMQVLAWLPDVPTADLAAALLCVAAGLCDRLRLLPFAALPADARAEACAAWREGDVAPLTRLALASLAAEARHLRVQLRLLLDAQAEEDAHLASIGRAAVTGRRALAVLRQELATSVPGLSAQLELSRPAAGAALERLVALGLAEEITGRGRDRVFVYAAAWGLL
ncbi:MAG TPA: hypothetical protein PK788_09665 [Gemmatimonadaceae bacterium]|nr:hypothetical protein [Gemmatimonadaceae bacterium]HRQ77994.1 hypothetical protein [Gemmatimonadaceae bacterium]